MVSIIKNLVFEGGGVLGIAYLGVLDYLFHNGLMKNIKRVAGTSAGAITACVTSFNLPFNELKSIADSLDYHKVPSKGKIDLKHVPESVLAHMEQLFGDVDCTYRLLKHYGWYSTDYFYDWIKGVIEAQFDHSKKLPPYTFADFKNPHIHNKNRPFFALYILGTDLSNKTSKVFSFETTPEMEVAQAVRISMSIPLFFEAVEINDSSITRNELTNVFCDGGAMDNYPITIFDAIKFNPTLYYGANMNTLGVRFKSNVKYTEINNLLDYIGKLSNLSLYLQEDIYKNRPLDQVRSININTLDVSPVNFDIIQNDDTYNFLYTQGYNAAKSSFTHR